LKIAFKNNGQRKRYKQHAAFV